MGGVIAAVIGGLVVLALASDRFVVGSARLATTLRVPAVVVGAVIVGFGTSAPELVVSLLAALDGDAGLAVGNITGSNLANLTLVLGAAACAGRVFVDSVTIRREAPVSTAAVCLFAVAVLTGLGTVSALVLLAGLVVALAVILRAAWRTRAGERALEAEVAELEAEAPRGALGAGALALGGLIGTLLGAQLVVSGAVELAGHLGLSQGFVGLTVVAVGTSLPELVTAVQAARRGEDELIVGNVLGSNLFNSLAAGGVVALTTPGLPSGERLAAAVAAMAAVALVVAGMLWWRGRITRSATLGLLAAYAVTVPLVA